MRKLVTGVCVCCSGASMLLASDAIAGVAHVSSVSCRDGKLGTNHQRLEFDSAFGYRNNDVEYRNLFCPIDESDRLWVDVVRTLKVRVSGSNTMVQACVLFDEAVGGRCGTGATSTSSSLLSPDLSVWQSTWFGELFAGDSPYLRVLLPSFAASGLQFAGIEGYWLSTE
jgi:hypothetical protein